MKKLIVIIGILCLSMRVGTSEYLNISLFEKATVKKEKTNGRISRTEYISTYSEIAIFEMERTGIPASITIAQAIIESKDGNSDLTLKGNNHFGIKCHDWNGETLFYDDDKKGECFRKYQSSEESFRDHSDFLKIKQRYSFLFKFQKYDYKAWAKGLKEAGYATSPTYAIDLINIIEDHKLYKYDSLSIKKIVLN